jgi:hypothetical protein
MEDEKISSSSTTVSYLPIGKRIRLANPVQDVTPPPKAFIYSRAPAPAFPVLPTTEDLSEIKSYDLWQRPHLSLPPLNKSGKSTSPLEATLESFAEKILSTAVCRSTTLQAEMKSKFQLVAQSGQDVERIAAELIDAAGSLFEELLELCDQAVGSMDDGECMDEVRTGTLSPVSEQALPGKP